ncbi:VOC family protein [Amycolatopsis acidiphila]|uniref:VOC family protein n=1 Tax=Amycolatopsis acidiphila TaxID=715473 RepID=A0A557ZMF1_9PSEU|nr:VOC family protein [Amycolatopsis acidiphila]TVT13180.1 VOC family protein [Amycolatopsis acidiphila]UIJ61055.1 VOC family protein [Amycolatopsis acidiphila]GHG99232.1 glyoxalase [Amycolatopsis acidiphila]
MAAVLSAVVIDCADPGTLAGFYSKVTGWDITSSDADTAYLSGNGTTQLGFQRIENYPAPGWPDDGKHVRLDFSVADVETAVQELLALGAARPEFQPDGGDWTVLTDPEGHPFCLLPEN